MVQGSQAYEDAHAARDTQDLEAGMLNVQFSSRQPTDTLDVLGPPANGTSVPEAPKGLRARCKAWFWVMWLRCKTEFMLELPLLKQRWLVVVACLIFQYIHAIFTTLAYHLHEPLPEPLHDIGFEIFPELGPSQAGVTEALVYTGFGVFAVWLVSPFVTRRKTFHAIVVLKRVLVILVTVQTLRIITFLSTQIPGPNYHCLSSSPDSTLPWPDHWWQNIIVNISRQASMSCGDLIFSSHTTFLLVFMWTYAVLGHYLLLKVLAFMYVAATSCLIIASRKHYTVDVVVAWYVVPAFYFHFRRHWTTQRNDEASPDGGAITACDTPPVDAFGNKAKAAGAAAVRAAASSVGAVVQGATSWLLGGMERLAGKLRLDSPKAAPHVAAHDDSQQLLAEQQGGPKRAAAGGAAREEGGSSQDADTAAEGGPAAAGAVSTLAGSGSGIIPPLPSKANGRGPFSQGARTLPLLPLGAAAGRQGQDTAGGPGGSESADSSTVALRGPGTSSADAMV